MVEKIVFCQTNPLPSVTNINQLIQHQLHKNPKLFANFILFPIKMVPDMPIASHLSESMFSYGSVIKDVDEITKPLTRQF